MKLHKHQEDIIATSRQKECLWMRPRTGKTPTSIRLACSRVSSCLVIVPKHIKEQWEAEIAKWNNTDCKFTIITKERFRIDSIASIKKQGRRQTLVFSDKIPKCEMVIIDEVHRQASNYANKFFKCLMNYLSTHHTKHILLLSGTPWNKSPWSPYSYGKLLGKDWKWEEWQRYFFTRIQMGRRSFYKPNEKMFHVLVGFLDKMGKTVRLEDITESLPDEELVEYFDLNAEQKKAIGNVTDTTPLARCIKYQQIEQGSLKSTGYDEGWETPIEKDKRILELAEDNDKLIIVCKFLAQIEKYRSALTEAGYKVYVIKGDMKENLKDLCEEANRKEKAIAIIQADKSDGYDMKSFSTMVFASMSYSFISYDQMRERMKSMTKKEPCQYIYLLTRGKSMDRAVYDSVKKGEDFNEKLFI
jgi:vacuolar-type H+-ATPase subunit F/Vma7